MDRFQAFLISLLLALPAGWMAGCSDLSATGGPRPLVKRDLETSVSEKFRPRELHQMGLYPLEAEDAVRESIAPHDLARLTDRLLDTVTVNTGYGIVAGDEFRQRALAAAQSLHGPLVEKARRFGKALDVQAVLFGVVNRYQESDGGQLGADRAASVRFRLWLVEVSSGDILWEASYDRSQKPLSENIFAIPSKMQSGVRYKDALDLAAEGFSDVANDLEKRRSEDRGA